MQFDNALKLLRQGVHMTRLVWNDPKQYVIVKEATFMKAMPDIPEYKELPYSFPHEDLLAKDWEVTRQ